MAVPPRVGVELFGDWGAPAANKIARFEREVKRRAELALMRAAVLLVSEIRAGIVAQAPGGRPFAPLAQATIHLRQQRRSASQRARVAESAAQGAPHKRLIDRGDLLRAITWAWSADRRSVRIGVYKGARAANGMSLDVIARIQTEGRVITVTPKMRAWLRFHGVFLRATTTTIVIPPAPFIEPTFVAVRRRLEAEIKGACARG